MNPGNCVFSVMLHNMSRKQHCFGLLYLRHLSTNFNNFFVDNEVVLLGTVCTYYFSPSVLHQCRFFDTQCIVENKPSLSQQSPADSLSSCTPYSCQSQKISSGDQLIIMEFCLLYTSPSPRDRTRSRMPSSA